MGLQLALIRTGMSLGRKVNGMNTDGKPEEKVQHLPKDAKQWAMVAHLISLAGLVVIVIGFSLGPFIVWITKREDHPFIDEQGKEALNFQLTVLLAFLVFAPLIFPFFIFIILGIVLELAVLVCAVIFPIIGATKASRGIHYRYPFAIRFIK
jgi:uncharacterized Tic20 family protein